jgi:hypothetical protein
MANQANTQGAQVMRHRLWIVVIATTLIFGSTVWVQAESTEVQITQDLVEVEDSLPQIKGNYVVWQRSVDGKSQIFLYDAAAEGGVPVQISVDPDHDHLNPQTDGQHVVWWSDKGSGAEVWLYDIGDGSRDRISPSDGKHHYLPVIASGRVAWVRYTLGDVTTREIFLYDVLDPPAQQITINEVNDGAPRINDQYLCWIRTDGQNSTVFVRDLSTGETQEASNPSVWGGMSPQKDGGLTVSLRHDGEDWEVIIRNRDLRSSESITDNELDDRHPRISGNKIVWAAGEGKMSEIFLAVIPKELALVSPANGAAIHKKETPTFAWRRIGFDEFKVQFSCEENFGGSSTITFPETASVWSSDLFFTPDKSQWKLIERMARTCGSVYWRVEGKDAGGTVAFSDPWHFTVLQDKEKKSKASITGIDQDTLAVATSGDDSSGDSEPGSDGGSSVCFIDAASASADNPRF